MCLCSKFRKIKNDNTRFKDLLKYVKFSLGKWIWVFFIICWKSLTKDIKSPHLVYAWPTTKTKTFFLLVILATLMHKNNGNILTLTWIWHSWMSKVFHFATCSISFVKFYIMNSEARSHDQKRLSFLLNSS